MSSQLKGTSINSEHSRLEIQICHSKARIAGNSRPTDKICNAAVADLGFKMRVHELIEMP